MSIDKAEHEQKLEMFALQCRVALLSLSTKFEPLAAPGLVFPASNNSCAAARGVH